MASEIATPVPTSVPCCATRSEETLTNVLSDATTGDFLPEELFSALAAIFAPRGETDFSARIAAVISRGATAEGLTASAAGAEAEAEAAGDEDAGVERGVGEGSAAGDAGDGIGAGADSGASAKVVAGAELGGAGTGVDEPGVKASAAGNEKENEGATVEDTIGRTMLARGVSGLSGEGKSVVAGAGEDGVGAASAGSTDEVKAIACGAWNAEAKSGAGAVLGAGAKWRVRISAGAKLRRAVSGATESSAISVGVVSNGSGSDAESNEGIPASARGERADGACGDFAAAWAADGATLGPDPMVRAGAMDAAGFSNAPANGNAGAVGRAAGVDRAAGAADAKGEAATGVSERGATGTGDAAVGRSRGVSDEVPVGVGAVSVSAMAIGAAGGGVTVAASARAISAESGPGSVGCSGARERDEGRARAGAAGFEPTDFAAAVVFSPRGETGRVTSTSTTVAAVVGTRESGTTTGVRGAEARAGCAVS